MVVLKGIPSVLSPELLYTLAQMGHGDELVLADANFPASSICACGPTQIRADGLGIPKLLEAILKLLPLDTYAPSPAAVMDLVDSDKQRRLAVPVWATYTQLLDQAGSQSPIEKVERSAFYERAKKAFAVVATGDLHRKRITGGRDHPDLPLVCCASSEMVNSDITFTHDLRAQQLHLHR
ncbi:fucose mutarotase isoform X2 [Cyclopterus lumpus]|uniref:fucose mutarotase isoform X2 n=1 Tax=Cyclopterus lumpus TaxID=8103 RepID=UPI0014869DB5|nr:fucose mutarotase isoform X2 [Cyclopterus lumpus]